MSTDTRRFTVGGSDCGAALRQALTLSITATSGGADTPCVEWYTAPADGYPRLNVKGRKTRAHRTLYEAQHGELPPGYVVHHTCENKRCVNPDHLRGVTRAQHLRMHDTAQRGSRQAAANRRNRTSCNHGHPFTPENTYYNATSGTRFCRECHLSRKREAYRRRREGAAS